MATITGNTGYWIPGVPGGGWGAPAPSQPQTITGNNGYWIPNVPGGGWGVPTPQTSAQPQGQQQQSGQQGGGGGGVALPPAWGTTPMTTGGAGWLPWGDWGQTPWATVPTVNAQEQQAWMNVALPWQQAQQQQGQWATDFAQRAATEAWNQQFQGAQFAQQQAMDAYNQALAQKQLEETARGVNMQTFGRRWQPQSRWM